MILAGFDIWRAFYYCVISPDCESKHHIRIFNGLKVFPSNMLLTVLFIIDVMLLIVLFVTDV